eukprot:6193934-Pleurochrysis_carterae.AAC.4
MEKSLPLSGVFLFNRCGRPANSLLPAMALRTVISNAHYCCKPRGLSPRPAGRRRTLAKR